MNDNISVNEKESMGSVIRRLRMERDWTQEELAARLGVSGQAVSKWETGQSLPDISQVPTLARTLGVTTDELFGMEDEKFDYPTIDLQGIDPEKAWEGWQEMGRKIREYEGIDGFIWSYVYAGFKLCHPESFLYHPDHAAEVREETLRYAEPKIKRMEKNHALGHSFRSLVMELHALAGNEEKARELAAKSPPEFVSVALDMGTIYHDLGRWDLEMSALTTAGSGAVGLLLDILAQSGEAALKLGWAEEALDAAEFGIALIGLLKGAANPDRDTGSLLQIASRAALRLGEKERALRFLAKMAEKPKQPGAVVRRAFYVGRVGGNRANSALERAYLLRALDHPDFAPLRDDPEFQAIRERAEALGEEQ